MLSVGSRVKPGGLNPIEVSAKVQATRPNMVEDASRPHRFPVRKRPLLRNAIISSKGCAACSLWSCCFYAYFLPMCWQPTYSSRPRTRLGQKSGTS